MAVAVIGAGTWGTAIAVTIAKNCPSEKIFLWGRTDYTKNLKNLILPENIYFNTDLHLTITHANDFVIAVPSLAFKDLIKSIASYNHKNCRILSVTKGMDVDTNSFFSDLVKFYFAIDVPLAVLAGPSFAQEVLEQKPTSVVLAFEKKYDNFANDLAKKISNDNFKIYFSHDLIGVQLGGVFKNILAVTVGICDGLELGANARAALITLGLQEMIALGTYFKADLTTLLGLSGVGDVILTCCNNQSRNRSFGLLLAKGINVNEAKARIAQAIEALDNIKILYNLSKHNQIKMPIVVTMFEVLSGNVSVEIAVRKLLAEASFL